MMEQLLLTLEVHEQPDGSFIARCPELSLTAHGRHVDEAVEHLKDIVYKSLAEGTGDEDEGTCREMMRQVVRENPGCYSIISSGTNIH